MLFSSIFRIELSLIVPSPEVGVRIRPRSGESASKLSRSSSSAGSRRWCRASGKRRLGRGQQFVDQPFGSGFVELTRMNCARCSATSSVMKALTKIGNRSTRASRIAAARCWPSTIQPGLSSSSSGMTSVPRSATRRRSPRLATRSARARRRRPRSRSGSSATSTRGRSGSPGCARGPRGAGSP